MWLLLNVLIVFEGLFLHLFDEGQFDIFAIELLFQLSKLLTEFFVPQSMSIHLLLCIGQLLSKVHQLISHILILYILLLDDAISLQHLHLQLADKLVELTYFRLFDFAYSLLCLKFVPKLFFILLDFVFEHEDLGLQPGYLFGGFVKLLGFLL